MRKLTVLIAAGVVLLAAILVVLLLKPHAEFPTASLTPVQVVPPVAPPIAPPIALQAAPQAATSLPPPAAVATPQADDSELAKDSTDPVFVNFMTGFRSSAVKACTASMESLLRDSSQAVHAKMATVCDCAADQVGGTITLGEARAATASALVGDQPTNAVMSSLKARFMEAGKTCMAAHD